MGHNLALVLTLAVFYAGVKIHQWWMNNHSPTGDPKPIGGVKPQVGVGVTPGDPTSAGAARKEKRIFQASAVEVWLAEQSPARRTNELIREAVRKFKISASTVKRKLRQLREDTPR